MQSFKEYKILSENREENDIIGYMLKHGKDDLQVFMRVDPKGGMLSFSGWFRYIQFKEGDRYIATAPGLGNSGDNHLLIEIKKNTVDVWEYEAPSMQRDKNQKPVFNGPVLFSHFLTGKMHRSF